MALGLNFFLVAAHPVDAASEVGPVVIHHVCEETVEEVEATIIGYVGRFKAQVPFADHSGMVAGFAHEVGHGRPGWLEVAPVAFLPLTTYSGCTDKVRITAR